MTLMACVFFIDRSDYNLQEIIVLSAEFKWLDLLTEVICTRDSSPHT